MGLKKTKRLVIRLYFFFLEFGIDPLRTVRSIKGLIFYGKDFIELKKQVRQSFPDFPIKSLYPCLNDRFDQGDCVLTHYFQQDLYVAQKVFLARPRKHVDVGSSLTGFVAHVASFRNLEVIDIRNVKHSIPNVKFQRNDITDPSFNLKNYCDSLSCLHVLEHLGLGRYGDTVDGNGYKKGLTNLAQMLEPNGTLYLSVPIGPQRIEFNAHRVFSVEYFLNIVEEWFSIISFSYVDDAGFLHVNAALEQDDINSNFSCIYGCGILELKRNSN